MVLTLDRQPVLEGRLLLVRPLVAEDFEPLFAVSSDPAIWEQHPSKDRTQLPVFQQWFDDALACGGALVVVDRTTGWVIGSSRYAVRPDPAEVEIGWTFLARSHWGGTYNGELKALMLEHAFRSVTTVVFTVHIDNHRSQHAVRRLGAVPIREEPDALGRGQNVVFQLAREAWTARGVGG